jgi:hypothetical protein
MKMKWTRQRPADRPRLELESTSFELVTTVAAWAAVALHAVVVGYHWPLLPAEVPQHFDARGEVDAWGPRALLLLLPGLALLLVGGLSWMSRYPHLFNYPWPITAGNAHAQYRLAKTLVATIKTIVAWLLCLVSLEICRLALGRPALLGAYFLPLGLGPMFVLIGWYFLHAYRER